MKIKTKTIFSCIIKNVNYKEDIMKINVKSLIITLCLFMILGAVILVEISLFISGPVRKYEDKIERQVAVIEEENKNIQDIQRHVFQYITYAGHDNKNYTWFNEEGAIIVQRKLATYQPNEALAKVKKDYGVEDAEITLGYGYDNPVYVATSDAGIILMDFDTLEEVYYLKTGDDSNELVE